jgi:hypothetical protein
MWILLRVFFKFLGAFPIKIGIRLRLQVLFAALMRAFRTPSGRGDYPEIQNFSTKLKNFASNDLILKKFVFLEKVKVLGNEYGFEI